MRFLRASPTRGSRACPIRFLEALPWPALLARRCHRGEASLEEIVSDPIVQAVMEADGVNPRELDAMLRRVAQHLSIAERTDAKAEYEDSA
jgi:hypothetical protein